MNILIASMSNLFLEAFQLALNIRRPDWEVSTHLIQMSSFNRVLEKKIRSNHIDIAVIDIADYQHFSIAITGLKDVAKEEVRGAFLVDSMGGEIYHHLKSKEKWIGVLKNTSLDEFIVLLENFKCNTPSESRALLKKVDKNLLLGLANGQTIEFLQHAHNLSPEKIERSLFRINAYFKTSNYIESIGKAIEQKVIVI